MSFKSILNTYKNLLRDLIDPRLKPGPGLAKPWRVQQAAAQSNWNFERKELIGSSAQAPAVAAGFLVFIELLWSPQKNFRQKKGDFLEKFSMIGSTEKWGSLRKILFGYAVGNRGRRTRIS